MMRKIMTTPQPTQATPGPQMETPPGLEPVYTNLARIAHSPADFVIDFAQILPGENKAAVRARILMSPLSAKLLLRALTENVARYEANLGEITVPTTLAENLFRPFHPPEQAKD
jgi:Protein of unknown function (DUF3467)